MNDIALINPATRNLSMPKTSASESRVDAHILLPPIALSHAVVAPSIEEEAVEQRALVLERDNLKASFEYDQQLKQIIITLRREDNGETVQQIPSEQVLRMLAGVMETVDRLFDRNG